MNERQVRRCSGARPSSPECWLRDLATISAILPPNPKGCPPSEVDVDGVTARAGTAPPDFLKDRPTRSLSPLDL